MLGATGGGKAVLPLAQITSSRMSILPAAGPGGVRAPMSVAQRLCGLASLVSGSQ